MALIKLGAGAYKASSVIQIVESSVNKIESHITTTSDSFVDSGLEVTIVPKLTNSLIVVETVINMANMAGTNAASWFKIYKDDAEISNTQYNAGYVNRGTEAQKHLTAYGVYTETSGSTSSRSFQIYFKSNVSGQTARIHLGGVYILKAMELSV